MNISCIIIEDEPPAAKKLESFISKIPFLQLTARFSSSLDAISWIAENKPDLIFLDIQMEHLTGIQLLESMQVKPLVILTTAYSEYALKGYELNVTDYLLKPFSFERFLQAVNKAHDLFQKDAKRERKTIFIKNGYALERIDVDDMLYVEGQKEFLQIVTKTRKVMTLMSFKALQDMLPADNFVRVHKSYLVAIDKIEAVERNRIKIAGELIPIGDIYHDGFYEALKR
ncbi:MAG TPA: DNA-binding response regulator [Bacteroidales bacterium]|nr:DNA-binding response regulator [Bacteroidales bacterium]